MTLHLPIDTGRLLIDRFRVGDERDLAGVVAVRDDASVARFQGWSVPYTVAQAERLIRFGQNDPIMAGAQLAIRDRSGNVVGDLYVHPGAAAHVIELGITIGRAWHNRGYASEVVGAIVDALFATEEVSKLTAIVATGNAASMRVFDRNGFRREGLTRQSYRLGSGELVDEVLFGLTKRDHSLPAHAFEVIAFDADDTLWESEDGFRATEIRFVELLTPWAPPGLDVMAALTASERKNLPVFGYGVKAFGLSMTECAATIAAAADRPLPSAVFAEIVNLVRSLLTAPVHLLPGVAEVLDTVGRDHRLVMITKGDLIHQTAKVEASGLAHHFERIEIVMEKDAATYDRIIRSIGVPFDRFCMVGNSVKSDILPVLAVGASAVHVPYHLLWELERPPQDHGASFAELGAIGELPAWLASAER